MRWQAVALIALWPWLAEPATAGFPGTPANTITLSDASGNGETNYPFQFGRPFLDGFLHSDQCLVVSANGVAVPTQMDVKNSYPDGSVEFAVVAVVVPSLPADGSSVVLTFAAASSGGSCSNSTPLTVAQMKSIANFDANVAITPPGAGPLSGPVASKGGGPWNALTMLANGNCQPWTRGQIAQTVVCADDSASRKYDIGFGDGYFPLRPQYYVTFWPRTNQVFVRVVGEVANPQELEWLYYGFEITGGAGGAIDECGGPNPQLSWCAGDLDGYAVLRATGSSGATMNFSSPVPAGVTANNFFATDMTNPSSSYIIGGESNPKNLVVGVGANSVTLAGAPANPIPPGDVIMLTHVYGGGCGHLVTCYQIPKIHWGMSDWTVTFWLGGTPNLEVNIDNNAAYVESTRFVPNYDVGILPLPATAAANSYEYFSYPHDIFDQQMTGNPTGWGGNMSTVGSGPYENPSPSWDVKWLMSPDWQFRAVALDETDHAANFPANLRESVSSAILYHGAANGSGLGLPVSIVQRPEFVSDPSSGPSGFLGPANDGVTVVGSEIIGANSGGVWTFDASHTFGPWAIPYMLTGDPYYNQELAMWASYAAAWRAIDRGPDGSYGDFFLPSYAARAAGWILRMVAEAAFLQPDGTPDKAYLTALVSDNLVIWGEAVGIHPSWSCTSYCQTLDSWAAQQGNIWNKNNSFTASDPSYGQPDTPPVTMWQNYCWAESGGVCTPTTPGTSNSTCGDGGGNSPITALGTSVEAVGWMETWTQWAAQWALGRAAELGFAGAEPLAKYYGQFLISMINPGDGNLGYPQFIATYCMISSTTGGLVSSWAEEVELIEPSWFTDNLPEGFSRQLNPEGYDANAQAALAPLVDEGAPGALTAWSWMKANVNDAIGANWQNDPGYDIVPRTDSNVLPGQPTSQY